jgi:hypothetical protein
MEVCPDIFLRAREVSFVIRTEVYGCADSDCHCLYEVTGICNKGHHDRTGDSKMSALKQYKEYSFDSDEAFQVT